MAEHGTANSYPADSHDGGDAHAEERNALNGDSFTDEITDEEITDEEVVDVALVGSETKEQQQHQQQQQRGNDNDNNYNYNYNYNNSYNNNFDNVKEGPEHSPTRRRWRKEHWIAVGAIVLAFIAGVVMASLFLKEDNPNNYRHFDENTKLARPQQPQYDDLPIGFDDRPGSDVDGDGDDDESSSAAKEEHEQRIKRERHFAGLAMEWSGEEALSTSVSPARKALDWILDDDPFFLQNSEPVLHVQQRYVAAVLYFATQGDQWATSSSSSSSLSLSGGSGHRRTPQQTRTGSRLRELEQQQQQQQQKQQQQQQQQRRPPANFLTNRDVCHWKTSDGTLGIFCNDKGSIVKLNFREFGLGGTLPQELGLLDQLTSLNFEDNKIAGTLPSQYGLLVNLERMGLESNQITGTIPKEFANLEKLLVLDLDENYLTGHLPIHSSGLKNIQKIEIAGSSLTGPLPAGFFSNNNSLQKLVLKGNKFYGSVPTEFGTLPKLSYLDLESNQLTGTIPTELGSVTSLKTLYLNGNDFAGSLDDVFCNQSPGFSLEVLVADCQGAMPEVKCSCCTSCCNALGEHCAERSASAPGTLPPTNFPTRPPIAQPVVTSPVPAPALSSPVETLHSEGSDFSSQLKAILVGVSDRELLEQKHTNQFKALMWMSLKDPSPVDTAATPHHEILQKYVLVLLYISTNGREWRNQNSFLTDTGTLGVCNWGGLECNNENKIVSIDLENNRLNGTLVSEIGSLGPSFRDLRLGNNLLSGKVPSELGLLPGLRTLDLSENAELGGTIPSQLSTHSLPNLKTLELAGTGVQGNLDPLFCTSKEDQHSTAAGWLSGLDIRANCLDPSVSCSCCLVCCDAAGRNCRTA